ncbi:MAG: tetratricopeptide repeat protein [Pseudomonadales bacterium]|jgi:tetratricopeptide (TPR) repeat protein|nr:tetratricopeptide repeat protein [Pseudomonadales bacterium]MDP7596889.1 tetratricopeptide repeat protein [Pseudomonadales bacterium]HJN51714.1 tetratricopeptide repeat protein [Pseudomonadales bacterium]|tara:strand:- start:10045 stop:11325 length:1281 start_codon:yes stop_codon:yes gene_type:complete
MPDWDLHRLLLVVVVVFAPRVLADESVSSLISRASAYEVDQQFELAAELYEAAISQTIDTRGESSIDLIEPLLGVGRSLIAQGYFDKAKETLRHAQVVAHRNEGVYSLRQLEVIDHMTDIALKSDDVLEANREQTFSFFVSEHYYGDTSLDLLPAYYKLAQWYLDTGRYYWVKKELDNAMNLIREQAGDLDPRLIEFLRFGAKSRWLYGSCCGEKLLAEALEIVAGNPQLAQDVKSTVYLDLGDAHTLRGKTSKAAEYYSLGYLPPPGDRSRSQPTMIAMSDYLPGYSLLFQIPLSQRVSNIRISDGPIELRHLRSEERSRIAIGSPIQFMHYQLEEVLPFRFRHLENFSGIAITSEFTVTSEGTLRDVQFVETNAPLKLNQLMRRALAKTRYRPALANGIPVDTEHVRLIQTFDVDDHETNETEN